MVVEYVRHRRERRRQADGNGYVSVTYSTATGLHLWTARFDDPRGGATSSDHRSRWVEGARHRCERHLLVDHDRVLGIQQDRPLARQVE